MAKNQLDTGALTPHLTQQISNLLLAATIFNEDEAKSKKHRQKKKKIQA